MGDSKGESKMEGWLYLIRSNRFGLQYSRKRYFVLKDCCLKSFKILPVNDEEVFSSTPFLSCFPVLQILKLCLCCLCEFLFPVIPRSLLLSWQSQSVGVLEDCWLVLGLRPRYIENQKTSSALRNESCKWCLLRGTICCWQYDGNDANCTFP